MRLGHSADALLQVPAEKKKCAALLHCATLSVHELPQYLVPLLSASRGRIACVVILGHAKLLAKRPFCGKAKKKKKAFKRGRPKAPYLSLGGRQRGQHRRKGSDTLFILLSSFGCERRRATCAAHCGGEWPDSTSLPCRSDRHRD